MWQSEEDIINDLAALNDFGEPGNTEPYKILCSVGRGSKPKRETPSQPQRFLDPINSEDEEDLSTKCLTVDDMLNRGLGRGSELLSENYSLLHKQLRLARPLGSSDELIESLYKKEPTRKVECSVSDVQPEKSAEEKGAAPARVRVKGVRNSNPVKNALMEGLLKTHQTSVADAETEKRGVAANAEALSRSGREWDYRGGEGVAGHSRSYHYLGEEGTSGSLREYKTSSGKETKGSEDERLKSYSSDIIDDDSNLSSGAEEEDFACAGGSKEKEAKKASRREEAKEEERKEAYRKLGERSSKGKNWWEEKGRRQKKELFLKGCESKGLPPQPEPESKPSPEDFVYDEANFPPLV